MDSNVAAPEAVPSAAAPVPAPEVVPPAAAMPTNVPAAVVSPSDATAAHLEQKLQSVTNKMKTEGAFASHIEYKTGELDKLKGTHKFLTETAQPLLNGDNAYYRLYGEKLERSLSRKIRHVGRHVNKLKKKFKVDPVMEVLEKEKDDLDLEVSDWEGVIETNARPYDEESSDEEEE